MNSSQSYINKGLAKFEEYKAIFAQAWNLPPEEVATWPNKWVKKPAAAEEEKKTPRREEPSKRRELTREEQLARVEPVRERDSSRREQVVLGIVGSIADGINALERKKLILEKYAAERTVSEETFNTFRAQFDREAMTIAKNIMALIKGKDIDQDLATLMLSDLKKAVPTLS